MNTGQRPAPLLPTFFVFYTKMVKNFVLYHLSNSLIFFALSFGITFVFFKTLSEDLSKKINPELVVFSIIFGVTTVAVGYAFPYFSFDKGFLKENLSKKSYHFLKSCQHYVVSMVVIVVLSVTPLAMGLLTFKIFLLIPVLMVAISIFSPLLLRELHQKTQSKYISQVFEKQWATLSKKMMAIVGLNSLYFLRKNKRNMIAGGALIVLMNICIVGYLLNNEGAGQAELLVIPFIASLFFAVDKNTTMYRELEGYMGSHKRAGFLSDYFFWVALLLAQWLLTLIVLLVLDLKVLPLFSMILLGIPLFVFYCLVLKFKYLENRILKSLSLGLSIVLPLIIPLFLFLFLVEIKDD